MLIVSVIVYSRIMNLIKWIECWGQCHFQNTMLVVIHNDNGRSKQFHEICFRHGIRYIRRENRGFDIGAMQDVFMERLEGFPNDWRYLLWCTDDVIPMRKDFAEQFRLKMLQPFVGVTAMHISPEVKPHVRTGCFCISKAVSHCIDFPADPVLTKNQCYQFEHRGLTLTDQVRMMGLDCVQVAPLHESPMYDTEYWRRNKRAALSYYLNNREEEHNKYFKHSISLI